MTDQSSDAQVPAVAGRTDAAAAGGGDADKDKQPEKPALTEAEQRRLQRFIEKGDSRLQAGDHLTALKHYLKAKEIAPSNALVYMKLGTAYMALEQTKEACGALRTFLRLQPRHKHAGAYREYIQGACAPGD